MSELIYKDEVYSIIGAAMEVHRVLGRGFLEAVYQEALQIELTHRCIEYQLQVELPVIYKGQTLTKGYVVDFMIYGKILLEIKALDTLTSREQAQILNYLKASQMRLGLLVNFGSSKLEWERYIN